MKLAKNLFRATNINSTITDNALQSRKRQVAEPSTVPASYGYTACSKPATPTLLSPTTSCARRTQNSAGLPGCVAHHSPTKPCPSGQTTAKTRDPAPSAAMDVRRLRWH